MDIPMDKVFKFPMSEFGMSLAKKLVQLVSGCYGKAILYINDDFIEVTVSYIVSLDTVFKEFGGSYNED